MVPRARVVVRGVAAMLVATLVGGCGGGGAPAARTPPVPKAFTQADFTPANFARTLGAPNRWLPLVPGTQWVRVGATDVGHRRVPHRVVSTVTDVHKRIAGVKTIAVLDQGIDSGQLAHESIDFFAQDRRGGIWDVGSYAEAYEAGRYVSVRDAWLAGVHGGRAGILMPSDPRLRTPPWYLAAARRRSGRRAGRAQRSRALRAVSLLQRRPRRSRGKASAPDNEFKYYAAGVGQIDNVPKSASAHHDVEQLVNARHLTARGLAEAGAEVLKLDRHARITSPSVYGHGPAARRPGAAIRPAGRALPAGSAYRP